MNAPLIEGIDIPNHPLNKNLVLIERGQRTQHMRRQRVGKDRAGGSIAIEDAIRDLIPSDAFTGHIIGGLTKSQCLRLGKQVCHQFVVMITNGVLRAAESDKINRDQFRALVNELVERVLPVGSGLPPDDRSGLIPHPAALPIHTFAIAFHIQLLQVRGKTMQILIVGQHGMGLRLPEVVIPDAQQTHQDREIVFQGGLREMSVHGVKPIQHLKKPIGADGHHHRQPDG